MFGNKKTKSNNNSKDSFSANTIQNGTTLEGIVKSEGNIRIDGRLDGSLTTNGKLVIGESGIINGQVQCENASIEGRIEGELLVNGLLILKQKAIINGDIKTQKIVVEEGAIFNGNIKTGEQSKLKHSKNDEAEIQKEAV